MSIKVKINNDWVDTNIKAVRGVNHVNSENVYTKEETEKKFATKTEVQTQINNSITKENIENIIGEVYTKTESDVLFSDKVSKSDIVQSTGTSTTSVMSQNAVSDAIKKKLNITDFNTFKADNTKTLNALDRNVSQNGSEIQEVNGIVQNHTDAIAQKADKTELATINAKVDKKVSKTDIVQNTGQSTTSVMSQKAVSDTLSNVYTKAESDAMYLRGEFEYCGLMEWDGKNEVKIYEMQFDSPKREVFIYGLCTWDNTNRGQFKIIITNETQPFDSYGISYSNSASNAEESFHIHNVCGNYVCDIINSNNHIVSSALKRCYMRYLLTDQNHEDVGLITNLKIEITTDLVRIDGVQKWFVFGKQ